ncbi:HVO_A0556 family zinc finger protein [Natrarchaeobius halalkaliphilus]|nr:HVO_A0556 family zinc finger protein [Natrarchaeobius halalkaliphilus]
MSQSRSDQHHERVLVALEGRPCPSCHDGKLERSTYKENRAAVCDCCGTPQAQVWFDP